jgi:hypothetical protein
MVTNLNNSEKITKTNLVLGFIIFDLVVIIIGILTWRLFSYKEVIDQMSLVSSISSILLALVAIVYAFFQTFSSSKQGEQMQNTLVNIDEKINELNEIKDEFEVIKDEFGLFREASSKDKLELLTVITEMDSKMQVSIETIFKTLKEKQIEVPDQIKQNILTNFKEQYLISKNKVLDASSSISHKDRIFNEVHSYIINNYVEDQEIKIEEIENFLNSMGHMATVSLVINILNKLVRLHSIVGKNGEGKYIRTHYLTNQK